MSALEDEDDGSPYAIHGAGPPTVPCPECRSPVVHGAKLCVQCGFDLTTRQKVARTYEPLTRRWEWGWPLHHRLALFCGLQAINGIAVVTGILAGGSIPAYLAIGLMFTGLQAFLLGTYERIDLTRSAKGTVRLARIWRVCFLERKSIKLAFRGCEGLEAGRSHRIRGEDWWMLCVLLCHFIVPGIIFWFWAIAPDRAYVAMLRDHGSVDTLLYLGLSEDHARDIATTVHEVTGLPLQAKL